MKFRKKPVVIDAVQWTGANVDEVLAFILTKGEARRGLGDWRNSIFLDTLEGTMRADPNDWVIKGVKGEFYPCKPDIFAATYEAVTDDDSTPADPERIRREALPYLMAGRLTEHEYNSINRPDGFVWRDDVKMWDRVTQTVRELQDEIERLNSNPQIGVCAICNMTIWLRDGMFEEAGKQWHQRCKEHDRVRREALEEAAKIVEPFCGDADFYDEKLGGEECLVISGGYRTANRILEAIRASRGEPK